MGRVPTHPMRDDEPAQAARAIVRLLSPDIPSTQRDQLLETRIRELGAYVLSIRCPPGCERPSQLELSGLVAQAGHLQLRAVLSKLRCTHCKRRPAAVTLLDHIIDGELPTLRVHLLP
jgi:hypothetical protein